MVTDREKLVELLAQACEWGDRCIGCKNNLPIAATCREERFGEAADHLLANGVTVNNWRDAKTDPPKKWRYSNGRLVDFLVLCHGGRVCVGNYLGEAKRWVTVGVPTPATRWQPLPELPKGGMKND